MTAALRTALLLASALLALLGNGDPARAASSVESVAQGCASCHPASGDATHPQLACTDCHGGNGQALEKEDAHTGMDRSPAHPASMGRTCGPCHRTEVDAVSRSPHHTLANEINAVRKAFGALRPARGPEELTASDAPATVLELVDDLLRRKCLRCHLFHPGDDYPAARHGTGCAACHPPSGGENGSRPHRLAVPTDDTPCLACHRGNAIGADFHGRFEQDVQWDFRTPFTKGTNDLSDTLGVEHHALAPDLHRDKGMICLDCHPGASLMGMTKARITCRTCHAARPGEPLPPNLAWEGKAIVLALHASGKPLPVPQASHPAHQEAGPRVDCAVCHALWSFQDQGRHLLRHDAPDLKGWRPLARQGDSEFASLFEKGGDGSTPRMTDKLTGRSAPGVWLQSFGQRRWEQPAYCRDDAGVLHVCRPMLDLRLSFVNAAGQVVFDNVGPAPERNRLLPCTPHTTGRAGAFWRTRLQAARAAAP